MARLLAALFFIVTLVFTGSPAQARDDRENCLGNSDLSPEVRILACTNLIRQTKSDKTLRAGAYFSRASVYWQKGIKDKSRDDEYHAIADYTQAIRLTAITPQCFFPGQNANAAQRPDCRSAIGTVFASYHNRDHVYAGIDDFKHAIADYTVEIEATPQFYLPVRYRAVAYSAVGDYPRAIDDASVSLKLYPQDDEAYRLRAGAYLKQRNFEKAVADYSQGATLAEARVKDNPAYVSQFYMGRAQAYAGGKKLPDAINDYSKAIQLDPQVAMYVARGTAYFDSGDKVRAIVDLNEAIRLEQDFAPAWNSRCWVEAISDELAYAFRDCNEAARLAPDNPLVLDSRGLVNLKIGNLDASIADYDAALKANPQLASSLYGRGLAKNKKQPHGGDSDLAAAAAIQPDIAKDYSGYGLK